MSTGHRCSAASSTKVIGSLSAATPSGSLEDRIQAVWPTTVQSIELLRGIASGLDRLHSQGIVHGDVKPANVLLSRTAQPLLADFGLARLPTDTATPGESSKPVGTPLYM